MVTCQLIPARDLAPMYLLLIVFFTSNKSLENFACVPGHILHEDTLFLQVCEELSTREVF